MWRYFAFFVGLVGALEEYSPNNFCANMNPQHTVNVQQLMGMWYGIEKIYHQSDRRYVKTVSTCPIIHISEDHTLTTMNPLYRNTQHYAYGEGYRYATSAPQYGKTQEQINRELQRAANIDREMQYRNHPRRLHQDPFRLYGEERYLRIFWDENGETTEYHVRYNTSEPGMWISSGPENGSHLKSQFSHYAGNIQVLKAVGNHMVLTFCHQLPERQLYSVLLSREIKLSSVEAHSVHRMLIRQDLTTHTVEKMCNNGSSSSSVILSKVLALISIAFPYFAYKILK